jgi:hypothetical protein
LSLKETNYYSALCFVDMPFGKKKDPISAVEIDFNHIYESAIKPGIEDAGLEALRGDEEKSGGIIHTAMFARLILAEFVIADLTLANANVFYELGVRHAAKPFTTVSIYANSHQLPFDVAMIRSINYKLENGQITDNEIEKLRKEIATRLTESIQGQATKDSPLFQLIPDFPGIYLPDEVTDAFKDRIKYEKKFQEKLENAKNNKKSKEEKRNALLQIQHDLGNLKRVQRNVLVDLMFSFRSVECFDEMAQLCAEFPDSLQNTDIVRQQWAFALNRCEENQPSNRTKAISILEDLIKEHGSDPETFGILGRVHKDRYKIYIEKKDIRASSALDDAIDSYTKGFMSDPRNYYPGINAITLLIEKGDDESLKKAKELIPLVSFAVSRVGGMSSSNYWDVATMLELSCINNDWTMAKRVLPRVLDLGIESWMVQTTFDNLNMLKKAIIRQGHDYPDLDVIMINMEQIIQK